MYCPMHFTNLIPCKDLYIAMLSEKGEGGIQARLSARAVFIADNYKSTLSSGNLRIYDETCDRSNLFLKKNTKFFNLENTKLIHFCDTTATAPRMSWQLSHKQFFPVTESFAIPQNQIKCQLYRVTVRLSDTFLGQYFPSCIIINRGSFFHLYCRIAKAGRRFGKLHKQSYIQGVCRYNF